MKQSTLTTILLLSCFVAMGQTVKIGEITIDSATASRYFTDCYIHPDTVEATRYNTIYLSNGWRQNVPIKAENSIGKIIGKYAEFIGWAVPRNPTGIDFIKWKFKQTHK